MMVLPCHLGEMEGRGRWGGNLKSERGIGESVRVDDEKAGKRPG